MAKYRLSYEVDLVGLEVPTKPEIPTPSVAPTYIPAPQPQSVPGYHETWQGYAPVPQQYVVPAPQTVTGGFSPVPQPQVMPQGTYAGWSGFAPVSPSQVGQQTPQLVPQKTPQATPAAQPDTQYTVPPPMLPNETPALVPEKVDLQAEHMLELMQNHLNEIQRLEQAGNAPENVLKEAKDKYKLELEKATIKAQVEELTKKVEKGEGEKGK